MRDIEGPGRTGISCRGDSPLFSLQLCKLGWFNQSNFTARLKLTVVQEQLLDVSCRITVDGDTVVVPAGAATSITLLDIKPSREALSEAKIIQRADDRLCIRRPPNATYRRHGSCYTRLLVSPPQWSPKSFFSFRAPKRLWNAWFYVTSDWYRSSCSSCCRRFFVFNICKTAVKRATNAKSL